jgi:hypothetical protein
MILRKRNGKKSKKKVQRSSELPLEMLLQKDKERLIEHLKFIKSWKKKAEKELKQLKE